MCHFCRADGALPCRQLHPPGPFATQTTSGCRDIQRQNRVSLGPYERMGGRSKIGTVDDGSDGFGFEMLDTHLYRVFFNKCIH